MAKLPRYEPNTEPPSWQIDYHNGPGDGMHRCYAYVQPNNTIIVCRDREAAKQLMEKHDGAGRIINLRVFGC